MLFIISFFIDKYLLSFIYGIVQTLKLCYGLERNTQIKNVIIFVCPFGRITTEFQPHEQELSSPKSRKKRKNIFLLIEM